MPRLAHEHACFLASFRSERPTFMRMIWVSLFLACGLIVNATIALGASVDPIQARRTAVVEVFQGSKDAVVNISSTQILKVQSPTGIEDLMQNFFDLPGGGSNSREIKRTSVGSGFVIHAAGYIVTNAHV